MDERGKYYTNYNAATHQRPFTLFTVLPVSANGIAPFFLRILCLYVVACQHETHISAYKTVGRLHALRQTLCGRRSARKACWRLQDCRNTSSIAPNTLRSLVGVKRKAIHEPSYPFQPMGSLRFFFIFFVYRSVYQFQQSARRMDFPSKRKFQFSYPR